jgi:hypothetical protein
MGSFAALFGGEDPENYYNGVVIPNAKTEDYTPQQQQAAQMQAAQIQGNALQGANGSAAGQAAQAQALAQEQQNAQGGLNATDKANLYQVQQQEAAQNQGQQQAIMQQAAQRGNANSGSSLAAQLEAAQGAQQQGADQGEQVAGQAAQRAIQQNQAAGELGGQINQQAFAQQAATGEAQNAINAANAQAQNQAAAQNTQAQNQASQFNIANNIGASQWAAQMQQQQEVDEQNKANAQAGSDVAEQGVSEAGFGAISGGVGGAASGFAKGGKVGFDGAWTGPSEMKAWYGKRDGPGRLAENGQLDFRQGGKVPGEPKVNHDSYANDTVPAMLTPKEVVIDLDTLNAGPLAVLKFLEKKADMCFDGALKNHTKSKKQKKDEKSDAAE